jgi:hypothetical protein
MISRQTSPWHSQSYKDKEVSQNFVWRAKASFSDIWGWRSFWLQCDCRRRGKINSSQNSKDDIVGLGASFSISFKAATVALEAVRPGLSKMGVLIAQ